MTQPRSRLALSRQPLANTRKIRPRQIHAAVDVEDVAGDVSGFVAGEEDDGGGDVFARAHAAERNAYFQFFFHLVRKNGGHWRLGATPRHRGVRDGLRSTFASDGPPAF